MFINKVELSEAWGPDHENDTHFLRASISHLREKTEANLESPEVILAEWGVGYRFVLNAD